MGNLPRDSHQIQLGLQLSPTTTKVAAHTCTQLIENCILMASRMANEETKVASCQLFKGQVKAFTLLVTCQAAAAKLALLVARWCCTSFALLRGRDLGVRHVSLAACWCNNCCINFTLIDFN